MMQCASTGCRLELALASKSSILRLVLSAPVAPSLLAAFLSGSEYLPFPEFWSPRRAIRRRWSTCFPSETVSLCNRRFCREVDPFCLALRPLQARLTAVKAEDEASLQNLLQVLLHVLLLQAWRRPWRRRKGGGGTGGGPRGGGGTNDEEELEGGGTSFLGSDRHGVALAGRVFGFGGRKPTGAGFLGRGGSSSRGGG